MKPVRAVISSGPASLLAKYHPCPSDVEDVNYQDPQQIPPEMKKTTFLASSSFTVKLEACETSGKP